MTMMIKIIIILIIIIIIKNNNNNKRKQTIRGSFSVAIFLSIVLKRFCALTLLKNIVIKTIAPKNNPQTKTINKTTTVIKTQGISHTSPLQFQSQLQIPVPYKPSAQVP